VSAVHRRRTDGAVDPRFPERRHLGRESALQMLYQWEVGRTDIAEVVQTYWEVERPDAASPSEGLRRFATELAAGTVRHLAEIDPIIAASAEHWRLERMAAIDRAILRLAVYEFLHAAETPRKAVINEALELAKTFSTDDAVKFVNGILDGIKRRLEEHAPDAPRA
jgi:N utilization substance protein B